MTCEEAENPDAEERLICEILIGTADQHTCRIDVLTSMDAHRIPLCIPTCPSPTFVVERRLILWNHRSSSSSCLWLDVRFATLYSFRNPFTCYRFENEGRSTEARCRSGSDEKHRGLTDSELLVFLVWQDSGIWAVNLSGEAKSELAYIGGGAFAQMGLRVSNAGKRLKKTGRVIRCLAFLLV